MARKDQTAQERIKQAFFNELQTVDLTDADLSVLLRIADALDNHFRTFCSFYDPAMMLEAVDRFQALTGQTMRGTLLPGKDFNRLSVTRLASAAGVNRATFYKFYPNVSALYDECCSDLTDLFLAVPIPEEKSQEKMYEYGRALLHVMRDNKQTLFILSHGVNRRSLPYEIAGKLCAGLRASISSQERASFIVQENLSLFPEMFSSFFSHGTVDDLFPRVIIDRGLPPYEPMRSFVENVAGLYSMRYGGALETYYTFGIAALRLLSKKDFTEINVSELCKTAGYSRNTFYSHFDDATDYVLKVLENLCVTCVSAFLFFLDHPERLTPETLRRFRKEMSGYPLEGVRAIFVNGSISFIFGLTFAYLLRILLRRAGDSDENPNGQLRAMTSYYVAYAMRLFSMYYIGDMKDAELAAKRNNLLRIKDLLGIV